MKMFLALALIVAPEVMAQQIPQNCLRWNDGCNTCSVKNGKKMGCTEMACFRQGTPKCLKFSQTTSSQQTQMCPDSGRQMCRMRCRAPNCPSGQCAMREGSCCNFKCKAPSSGGEYNNGNDNDGPPRRVVDSGFGGPTRFPSRKTSVCAKSPMQMCKMRCSVPNCPANQCAMRQGRCCDFKCASSSSSSSSSGVGAKCVKGFSESGVSMPCKSGLSCVAPANQMCAGTCYGKCQKVGGH
jgi:hypothetical protein